MLPVGNEQVERLQREADVLQRRHVEPAQHQQLVGPVERGQHRPVEERRGVDDDHVVRLPRHLEQPRELRLGHELGVLRAQRRRQDVDPAPVPGHVAGELLGVELARGDDEVVDRLLRLEPEHDRGVPELEVEVEQERALLLVLREAGGQVRRGHRLAGPALRREDRDDAAATGVRAFGDEPAARGCGPCAERRRRSRSAAAAAGRRRRPRLRARRRAAPTTRPRRGRRRAPASARGSRRPRLLEGGLAWTTTWRWPPAAGVASPTCSLQPTKSISGCVARPSRSWSSPSHEPVT